MKQEEAMAGEIRDFFREHIDKHDDPRSLVEHVESSKSFDPVDRPSHYYQGKFNVLEVQEDWAGDEPLVHAAIKYIARRKYKGKELEDLKKSVWYLNRHIKKLEEKK